MGLAARARLGAEVLGWDRDPAAAQAARERGALDEVADSPEAACAGAEVVVAAAPPAALRELIVRALAGTDGVVTDVGSTKAALVAGVGEDRYIGGHPLAGGETTGVAHAREDLFAGATWYLTPREDTSGVAFEQLHRFVSGLGAAPVAIDAATHDRVMAAVSHLPHLLANVLVERAAEALDGEVLPPVGPSFRDATRVAGANPALWGQIYAANAAALGAEVDAAIARLQELRGRLADLEGWQAEVAALKGRAAQGPGGPTTRLDVSVLNRPGIVAEIALALGRAGVDIADMSLAPSPDRSSGVVALWVAAAEAARARGLIAHQGLEVT